MTAVGVVHLAEAALARSSASTEGRLVYAIGDVHGRYDLLLPLLEAIAADMEAVAPPRRPLLVALGDYVDRGPRSAQVVASLVWLSRNADFDVRCLRGNHEEMMLAFLADPLAAGDWLHHGGVETLAAYGVGSTGAPVGEDDPERLRDGLLDRLPASHLAFLRSLESRVVCGDYVFVHAGLRPGVTLLRQSDADLLWIRDEFLDAEHAFEKVVVHGHSWRSGLPTVTPHRIGVDTGAYETDVLTAVRLGHGEIAFFRAKGNEPRTA